MTEVDWVFFFNNYEACLNHARFMTRLRYSNKVPPGDQKILFAVDSVRPSQMLRDASYYGGCTFGILSPVPVMFLTGFRIRPSSELMHPWKAVTKIAVIGVYFYFWESIFNLGSNAFLLRRMPTAFDFFLALPKESEVHTRTVKFIENRKAASITIKAV